MALWIADEGAGLIRSGAEGERRLCAQPLSLCACGNTLVCAQAQQAAVYAADTGAALGRYPLPPGARRMCALPGALYCLSSDADSISLLCPRTGRLLLCAQAGCYPRDLALSPCRRMLAVAGGAAGAVLVYRARELTLIRSLPLPGRGQRGGLCRGRAARPVRGGRGAAAIAADFAFPSTGWSAPWAAGKGCRARC